MAYNEEYWTLVSAKAELEEYMSPRLPDEEMLIPGPSLLGLAEQRNKILVHLKKQGVEVPEHLVSPPLDEFPRTRQDPSLHMTLLLMWVGEQGILLPPALYKTRPPISHKDLPKEISEEIKSYGPFHPLPYYGSASSWSAREDCRREYRCALAMRLPRMNNAEWKAYDKSRAERREARR